MLKQVAIAVSFKQVRICLCHAGPAVPGHRAGGTYASIDLERFGLAPFNIFVFKITL
jgi:hypothetical protein